MPHFSIDLLKTRDILRLYPKRSTYWRLFSTLDCFMSLHILRGAKKVPVYTRNLRFFASKSKEFGEVRHIPLNQSSTLGVLRKDREKDIRALLHNYTSPILAEGLRDRETNLQLAAELFRQEKWGEFL